MAIGGLDAQLETLEGTGLIRLAQAMPELEYLFRHTLVQDAAYGSLTKNQRRKLHQAIGQIVEALYPDRLDELAGVLSHHYAAAEQAGKAVEYARRAARQSVARHAYEEAIQHLEIALDLKLDAEVRLALTEELADVCRLLRYGGRALSLYKYTLDGWESLGQADRLVILRLHRKVLEALSEIRWAVDAEVYERAADVARASRERVDADLETARGAPPHAEIIRLLAALSADAWISRRPADWQAAAQFAEDAVEMAESLGDPVELCFALGALNTIYFGVGRLHESLDISKRRLEITRSPGFGDIRQRIDSLQDMGNALVQTGRFQEAIPYLGEAKTLARSIHAFNLEFNALAVQSLAWFRLDRWDESLDAEAKWVVLKDKFTREQTGPTCFPTAVGGSVRALRGYRRAAENCRQEAYEIMQAVSGEEERWQRNQYY